MLWRESYKPEIRRDVVETPFDGETFPLIGSSSLLAGREVEVWWRLFEEDFPGAVFEVLPDNLASEVMAVRAPSRQPRIRFDSRLIAQVEGLADERAFCLLVHEGVAKLTIIGPPTEEVWDEVASLWRTIRT